MILALLPVHYEASHFSSLGSASQLQSAGQLNKKCGPRATSIPIRIRHASSVLTQHDWVRKSRAWQSVILIAD